MPAHGIIRIYTVVFMFPINQTFALLVVLKYTTILRRMLYLSIEDWFWALCTLIWCWATFWWRKLRGGLWKLDCLTEAIKRVARKWAQETGGDGEERLGWYFDEIEGQTSRSYSALKDKDKMKLV